MVSTLPCKYYKQKVEMTLIELIFKGGPLMYLLIVLSVFLIGLVIAKYRQILKVNSLHRLMAGAIVQVEGLESRNAAAVKGSESCPLGAVLLKAKSLSGEDIGLIKDSVEATANLEVHRLEKGLGWISTISAVAPLVGFLGTVTGMVKVFINIASHSQQGIDISLLAGGIWEALLTTVAGLIIGIPAIIFYNDLVTHVDNNAKFLQEQINDYLVKLHRSSH